MNRSKEGISARVERYASPPSVNTAVRSGGCDDALSWQPTPSGTIAPACFVVDQGSAEPRPTGVGILSVHDLAERFNRGTRWAALRMRDMRHMSAGGEMFTTEEWLAEWLAAKSVPQANWPKQNLDPLEEAVCSRVISLVGDLARSGRIKVVAV